MSAADEFTKRLVGLRNGIELAWWNRQGIQFRQIRQLCLNLLTFSLERFSKRRERPEIIMNTFSAENITSERMLLAQTLPNTSLPVIELSSNFICI